VETLRSIEVDYVPARAFKEEVASSAEPVEGKKLPIEGDMTFEVLPEGEALSGIAIPIGPSVDYAYVNIKAKVQAVVGGETVDAGVKEWFMPEEGDWLYVPVANVPRAERYLVTLTCDTGSAHALGTSEGKPAWRAYRFVDGTVESSVKATESDRVSFAASSPFAGMQLQGTGLEGAKAVLAKRVPGGTWQTGVTSGTVVKSKDGSFVLALEPQPAGVYQLRIEGGEGRLSSNAAVGLVRIQETNPATRYLLGQTDEAFAALMKTRESAWKAVSGLSGAASEEGVFTARLSGENPVIETGAAFSLPADESHAFHAVLKNATSASFLKVWWKTEGKDYDEADTLMIPIVPNDDRFREYSWLIGDIDSWEGTLTGLRVMPVYGHTETGSLAIATLDLRKGIKRTSRYAEALELAKVSLDGPIGVDAAPNPAANRLPDWAVAALAALGTLVAAAWAFAISRRLARRKKK
jgi:hypothetical protein